MSTVKATTQKPTTPEQRDALIKELGVLFEAATGIRTEDAVLVHETLKDGRFRLYYASKQETAEVSQ
jgi:hypothetical protein